MFPPVGGQVACPDCPAEGRVAGWRGSEGPSRMLVDPRFSYLHSHVISSD